MDSGDQWEQGGASEGLATLRSELRREDLARHLALFFRSTDVQLATVTAFVKQALRTNRRCLYLTDVNTPSRIRGALRAAGVDVAARVDAGDLVVTDASEVYLAAEFDPDRLIETLERNCEESVAEGYDGLWVAGENTWCFHTEASFDHILDFEASFDAACPDLPVTALCQYDVDRFGEQSTAKALRTHEQIIYRYTICENPFYVSPSEYRAAADPHENAQFMLEQAYDLTRARRQVDRRKQHLSVVSRVLRHNIRNDINVVQGVLQSLVDGGTLDDATEEQLRTALQRTGSIVDMADRARYVQGRLDEPEVAPRRLAPVVESAVATVESEYPAAEIDVRGDVAVDVLADVNLERALVEVLTNAVEHQSEEPVRVSLTASTPAEDSVVLDVRNPGPPIPSHERRTLERGYETQLEHGSGLGLWLTKWIVENAHGHVSAPDTDGDGGRIVIELYRVPG